MSELEDHQRETLEHYEWFELRLSSQRAVARALGISYNTYWSRKQNPHSLRKESTFAARYLRQRMGG